MIVPKYFLGVVISSQFDVFSDPLCCLFHQLQFSEVLVKWRQFFNLLSAHQGKSDMAALEQKLDLEQVKVGKVALGYNCNWL